MGLTQPKALVQRLNSVPRRYPTRDTLCRFIIGGLVGVIVMVVVCAVVGVMRQRQRQQQLGMELLQLTREQSEVLTRRPARPVEPSQRLL